MVAFNVMAKADNYAGDILKSHFHSVLFFSEVINVFMLG